MSPADILAAFLAAHPWLESVGLWILVASGAASILDAALPQPAPGSHWIPVRKLISAIALNFANAANAAQPSLQSWLVRALLGALRSSVAVSHAGAAGAAAEQVLALVAQAQADIPSPQSPETAAPSGKEGSTQ